MTFILRLLFVLFALIGNLSVSSAQNEIDIYPFTVAYKGINNQTELDSVNKIFSKNISNNNAQILNKIAFANAVDQLGNHDGALQLMKSIKISTSNFHPIILSEYNVVMGNIAIRSQNPSLAVKHFKESISILEKEKDIPIEIYQSKLMTLGTGFNAMEDNASAMEVFEKALQMETNGTNRNSLYLRLNIALTNSKLGELTKAKAYFTQALYIIRLNEDFYAETRTLGNLADIYFEEDSIELAQKYYEQGKYIALQEGYILDLIRFETSLSKLYEKKGDYTNAYKHLVASDSISNQYNSSSISEQIVALELQHQIQQEKLQKEAKSQLLEIEENKKMMLIIFSIILFLVLIVIVWLLALSKKKNKILLQQNLDSLLIKQKKSESEKIYYSEIIEMLEMEMETNKLYAESSLTLDSLSKKLQTNRTYLSEAINNHYGLSFSQWINDIRIFHAKEMLFDESFDAYSIEGISSLVGFSSISAFNSNFKKITGITPSYFRNNKSK
jgi:AraC-like DNA-binding protein